MKRVLLLCAALGALAGGGVLAYSLLVPSINNLMPLDRVAMPKGPAKGVVFLMSDASGWTAREDRISARLQSAGDVVVGVDTPAYLATIGRKAHDCAYLVADVERLSQQYQRESGAKGYAAPIVAGIGLGGGIALDMVDQTPNVTIGGTAVADPTTAIPFPVELCTPAGYFTTAAGEIYALPHGAQVDPVSVLLTQQASDEIRTRINALKAGSPNVTLATAAAPSADAMVSLIETRVAAAARIADALPVTLLPTKPKYDAMAIILSGDGGWRDIDSSIGKKLQADGVPVVGLDSLRYFWSRRTPQETASDLAALIEKYRSQWGVKRVILVGYSFGADVLPATYRALPQSARDPIAQISLLGFSTAADWQITVSGWFGSHSNAAADTMTDAKALPMAKLQCVYGVEAHNDACPPLGPLGAELLETKGGHHFGGNYTLVEQAILSGLTRRTHTPFPATRVSASDLSSVHAMTATAEPTPTKAHTTFYP
ncbi:MAG: virulence factor family protein [Paracoccaceae bacterium]|nr:virulence factor family protein [Paracoccaceae bacterium]